SVLEGVVRAASANALGTTAGATNVSSGAALEVSSASAITIPETISLNGSGFAGGSGSLRSVANVGNAAVTIGGTVTLSSANSIGVDTGNTMILTGTVSGSGGLTKVGSGILELGGTTANNF